MREVRLLQTLVCCQYLLSCYWRKILIWCVSVACVVFCN